MDLHGTIVSEAVTIAKEILAEHGATSGSLVHPVIRPRLFFANISKLVSLWSCFCRFCLFFFLLFADLVPLGYLVLLYLLVLPP